MKWTVDLHPEFAVEFGGFSSGVRVELLALLELLEEFGPRLGRPHVDTLNNSKFSNMKELRFRADNGVWRVAFAFDPRRMAILLVAGDKSGNNEKRFYKKLIHIADKRFKSHLEGLREQ